MNEENITRIKYKNGNLEIDVSGPNKDFVEDQFKKLFELSNTTEASEKTSTLSNQQNGEIITKEIGSMSGEKGIKVFAQDTGISEDELKNVYDFKKGYTQIHKIIPGKDPQRQRDIALLTLIANLKMYGNEETSGKALTKNMTEQKVSSMSNLAKNLKVEEGISMVGAFYRLNTIGKQKAVIVVKKYCSLE